MLQTNNPETKHWSQHILAKVFIIGFIALALMIPGFMITELVRERASRKIEVTHEVSSKWGQLQTITGPYIEVPYLREIKHTDKSSEWQEEKLYYFPADLVIDGTLTPVEKKRSIFTVMLYESNIQISGSFGKPDLKSLKIDEETVMWEQASLHVALTDLSGIGERVELQINDTIIPMTAGAPKGLNMSNGLMANLPANISADKIAFNISLNLKGSQAIYFSPVAAHNKVHISSSWPSPKFEGQFLPDTSSVSNEGFNAYWTILDINRVIAQQWTNSNPQSFQTIPPERYNYSYDVQTTNPMGTPVFGVELLDTVDHYSKSERTAKYAFLLIMLTFVVYFFCEVLKNQRVHPLQYGLVGAALVIFFILLLSLSEQIGFDAAYIVSSLATITLITLYSRTIFTSAGIAHLVGLLLMLQFGFIYIILQLEDFALLAGSIALFVILALIMYLTRKVKW